MLWNDLRLVALEEQSVWLISSFLLYIQNLPHVRGQTRLDSSGSRMTDDRCSIQLQSLTEKCYYQTSDRYFCSGRRYTNVAASDSLRRCLAGKRAIYRLLHIITKALLEPQLLQSSTASVIISEKKPVSCSEHLTRARYQVSERKSIDI